MPAIAKVHRELYVPSPRKGVVPYLGTSYIGRGPLRREETLSYESSSDWSDTHQRRTSEDGGRTWSNELWTTAGAIGEYRQRAEWRRLGRGRDWVFEVSSSDPVFWAFIDCWVDAEGGIS